MKSSEIEWNERKKRKQKKTTTRWPREEHKRTTSSKRKMTRICGAEEWKWTHRKRLVLTWMSQRKAKRLIQRREEVDVRSKNNERTRNDFAVGEGTRYGDRESERKRERERNRFAHGTVRQTSPCVVSSHASHIVRTHIVRTHNALKSKTIFQWSFFLLLPFFPMNWQNLFSGKFIWSFFWD